MPIRFQQSSTSDSSAMDALTTGLLSRRARLQAAGAFHIARRRDQCGQMQQGFAMRRIQVQRLAIGGLRLTRVARSVLQQAQQMQAVGAGAMDFQVRPALRQRVLHAPLVRHRRNLAQGHVRVGAV
ncbi:hypothetical protein G6F45_013949 [Rhizopus arrhizus]|nr:hypothetical protein G6F45_013949 [Rhizopus arrhizus]